MGEIGRISESARDTHSHSLTREGPSEHTHTRSHNYGFTMRTRKRAEYAGAKYPYVYTALCSQLEAFSRGCARAHVCVCGVCVCV